LRSKHAASTTIAGNLWPTLQRFRITPVIAKEIVRNVMEITHWQDIALLVCWILPLAKFTFEGFRQKREVGCQRVCTSKPLACRLVSQVEGGLVRVRCLTSLSVSPHAGLSVPISLAFPRRTQVGLHRLGTARFWCANASLYKFRWTGRHGAGGNIDRILGSRLVSFADTVRLAFSVNGHGH
jgi:hypothetical protein